mmetsp:Transcript_21058/g.53387  ORF Transcript_21058/g.53387 Transcript_21058/m.53387 type:complete len:483 (-) Transcript_21058:19-1467(-)
MVVIVLPLLLLALALRGTCQSFSRKVDTAHGTGTRCDGWRIALLPAPSLRGPRHIGSLDEVCRACSILHRQGDQGHVVAAGAHGLQDGLDLLDGLPASLGRSAQPDRALDNLDHGPRVRLHASNGGAALADDVRHRTLGHWEVLDDGVAMDLGHSSLNSFSWPSHLHHRLLALATRPDGRPTPRLEVPPTCALMAPKMHRSIPGQRHLAAALPLEQPQQRPRCLDLRAAARELRGGGATIAGLVDAQLRPGCRLDVSQDCASPGHQALKSLPVQLNRLRSMSVEHFLQERPRPTNSVRLSKDVHHAGLGSRIHLQPSSGAGFDVLDARARPSDDDADDSARHLHTSLGHGAAFQPLKGLLDCCKLPDELNSTSLSCRDRLRVDKNEGTSVGFKHPNPRTAFPNDPPSNVLRNLETPKGMSHAQEVFQLGNGIGYAKGLNPADSLEVLVHPQVEHPALLLQSPSLCACLADDPPAEALGHLEV